MNNLYLYIGQYGDAYMVRQQANEDSLTVMQTLVDGLIEYVAPSRLSSKYGSVDVWVNEEGMYHPAFGINFVASYITGRQLVGPAVIAGSDREGKTISIPSDAHKTLIKEGLLIQDGEFTAAEIVEMYKNDYRATSI